jgi:hypothetical protein
VKNSPGHQNAFHWAQFCAISGQTSGLERATDPHLVLSFGLSFSEPPDSADLERRLEAKKIRHSIELFAV